MTQPLFLHLDMYVLASLICNIIIYALIHFMNDIYKDNIQKKKLFEFIYFLQLNIKKIHTQLIIQTLKKKKN